MRVRSDLALVPRPRTDLPAPLMRVVDGRLVPTRSPDLRVADGFLRLTAHILLEAERHGFRTLGVLSARRGEGNTTAAINLAACLGRTRGRTGRVLLVDGDARERTLTHLFCGDANPGRPAPVLLATPLENVDLLTAAAPVDGPSIHAPAMWLDMLRDLSGRYAQVVIDCPPVLADAEGMVLRECVEAIVLVVEAGTTTRRMVEAALGGLGSRVVGVVLHGADGEAGGLGGASR